MPTYDYECSKCGHTFDAFQNMSDDPLRKCPECNRMGLKRLIGGGLGVIFKGSGFYSTDSRSSSKATSTPASSETSTGDSGSSATEKPKSGEGSASKSDGSSKSGTSEGSSGSAKKSSEKVAG